VAPVTTRYAVEVAAEGTRPALARAKAAALVRSVLQAERAAQAMVSVTFLSARAMAKLNRKHLQHHGATDVITFAFAPAGGSGTVGDIYICPDVARANARHFGCGVREETARLIVHGTLHVLGYEHPEGEARVVSPMWRRQEALVRRLWVGSAAR
jgi:probable rRNA maturation factor